jgi:hypothetical protein
MTPARLLVIEMLQGKVHGGAPGVEIDGPAGAKDDNQFRRTAHNALSRQSVIIGRF